jgi:hypothetical protein
MSTPVAGRDPSYLLMPYAPERDDADDLDALEGERQSVDRRGAVPDASCVIASTY